MGISSSRLNSRKVGFSLLPSALSFCISHLHNNWSFPKYSHLAASLTFFTSPFYLIASTPQFLSCDSPTNTQSLSTYSEILIVLKTLLISSSDTISSIPGISRDIYPKVVPRQFFVSFLGLHFGRMRGFFLFRCSSYPLLAEDCKSRRFLKQLMDNPLLIKLDIYTWEGKHYQLRFYN